MKDKDIVKSIEARRVFGIITTEGMLRTVNECAKTESIDFLRWVLLNYKFTTGEKDGYFYPKADAHKKFSEVTFFAIEELYCEYNRICNNRTNETTRINQK